MCEEFELRNGEINNEGPYNERKVFVVSDRTGITAETLSHSLLTQFPGVRFRSVTLPYTDTPKKAREAAQQINQAFSDDGSRPLVFSTFVDDSIRLAVMESQGVFFDFFDAFIGPLEHELAIESSHSAGHSHGMVDIARYTSRISAVNYSVHCDDGINTVDYERADVILVGVSRSGKTPTCLYLALHFGLYAANYPLTEEDLDTGHLPAVLVSHRQKLFALTIDPLRLQQIRLERRGSGRYAQLKQCRSEVSQAEAMFRRERIDTVDSTSMSIEEISTTILDKKGISRDML